MQLKILNNADAMAILLDLGHYADEERLRLQRLNDTLRYQKVVDIGLYRKVRQMDEMFFHIWYVECLLQKLVAQKYPVPEEISAAVDKYVHRIMDKIDREFTVASQMAGIV
ncbi:MAG: hypothetical protein EON60_10770 [Alphaproteobacteria bacterium]|nr:MAG: hypothetical protein EON60_10770 [Alphaproteobacteria bacterium]